jgi:ABC-type bacteriocin/lantibiotic exporter with double-glycine peptidase domain
MNLSTKDIRRLLRLVMEFLGSRVLVLIGGSIGLGLLVFAVELLMAFSIQSFFISLGLMEINQNQHWLNELLGIGSTLNEAVVLLLVVGTLRGLFNWLQNHIASLTTVEFETLNRNRLSKWAFGERSAQVSYVASLFNDKTVGAGSFVSSVMAGISRAIVALLLIVTLIRHAPEITLIAFALLSILYIPFGILARRIRTVSDEIHIELDSSMSRLLRGVKNILLLHIYGLHKRELHLTERHLNGYLSAYRSYHFLAGIKNMMPQVVGIWLVCLITFTAKSQGALQGAQIVEYFYLFIRFVQCIGELSSLASYISLTRPRLVAVWDWWLVAREKSDEWAKTGVEAVPFEKPVGWEIRGLTYGYPGSHRTILNNLSLTIAPGSALVITGASGSGKSTLLGTMLGIYHPSSGGIVLLNDDTQVPLEVGRLRLLAGLGYVGPESFIIPGTVRENLLYGLTGSQSDEKLQQVLVQSDCGFIFDIKNGLNYILTEQGEGLSAGQKQRLALARALLRNPRVLILDEATANLDNATEKSLVDTLAKLKGTMTIIAVTHREELLRIADHHLILSEETLAD